MTPCISASLVVHAALLITCAARAASASEYDFASMIQPVPEAAKFSDPDYHIWCGTMVRGDDGKYHLYYSRWRTEHGFNAWVTHSEIAHAVGGTPLGPFAHRDVALPERGNEFWDGHCTHNPTIQRFGGKFYLYYMGNRGDREPTKGLNWSHRNNQRIGVAVADSPDGPWTRSDTPLLAPTPGFYDALCCNNPSVTSRPDGGYLMVYKAVGDKGKAPFGGPVLHCVATSDSPTGPFKKHPQPIFVKEGIPFAAEDPFVWNDGERYWAIVKDNAGYFTGAGRSTALWESRDGFDWQLSRHPLVATTEVTWQSGRKQKMKALERPQIYFENGRPTVLLFAASPDDNDVAFNVRIPLRKSDPNAGVPLGEPGRPAMGVYRDVGRKGTSGADEFAAWLGRPIVLGHDSMPTVATWEHMRGEPWLLDPWSEWKKQGSNRRFVLSVAMLPGPPGLKGPTHGTAAGIPVSFEAGARGEYNGYFTALAENLIKAGLEDSILRIGWEMNGGWYTWSAQGREAEYAGYWRQIVKAIRAVPGASKIQFTFNPTDDPGACDIEKAWPGDAFVDFVGVDIYDCSWIPETYPYSDGLSEEEILNRKKRVWNELHQPRLELWRRFAERHKKPLCFPEWGLCARPARDGHGGGDDPWFIKKMHEFMTDPKNNVVAQSYFDCSVPGDVSTDHRICPDATGFTRFPKSAAMFRQLFGKP